MSDDAILVVVYLTGVSLVLLVIGVAAEVMLLMDARRRRGGATFKMAEPAARGVRPPTYRRSWLTKEEISMALSNAGPLAKDIVLCRKCGEPIVFLQSINAKKGTRSRMPVNLKPTTPKLRPPDAGEVTFIFGQHQSHFATCASAEYFWRQRDE